jgi:hypothetical protein
MESGRADHAGAVMTGPKNGSSLKKRSKMVDRRLTGVPFVGTRAEPELRMAGSIGNLLSEFTGN